MRLKLLRVNQRLKLFEEYSESYYQTTDFDDYDSSYHNRIEMSDNTINRIKDVISSRTTNPLSSYVPSNSVMFIWDNNPSQYAFPELVHEIKIFEADDEWFYCAIKPQNSRDRILPARSIEYYKCDQLVGLIQLLKSKKII